MGGTKIFVVQLKELIKMAIFAVIGIVLIIMLVYFFIPKDKSGDSESAVSKYNAGTYSSEIILHNDPVQIQVTVDENEITAIELKDMVETQEVFYPLIQPTLEVLSKEIIDNQTLDISVSPDTPYTGSVLLWAINDAVKQAEVVAE